MPGRSPNGPQRMGLIVLMLPGDYSCAKVLDMLKKLKKDIDAALRQFLKDTVAETELESSPGLLRAGIKDFLERDGKRIRPILFLLSYQGYTKRKKFSYDKLLRSSLSLELLHDFLLIHDDVIDKSDLRRGRPTLHRLFNGKLKLPAKNELGPNLSIIAGDIIFALAVKALFSFEEEPSRKEQALLEFTKTTVSTGIGEFLDVMNNIKKIEKIRSKDVFLTYILKTAKYTFECPLLTGAMLAGAEKKELKKLSRLGIVLGQAFQIQDDLLDMFSSSEKIGKPVLSDLGESKKTLLVWKTYQVLSGKDKKFFGALLDKNKKNRDDLLKARTLIKKTGADKYCADVAASLLREAKAVYAKLRMKTKYKTALKELVETYLQTTWK